MDDMGRRDFEPMIPRYEKKKNGNGWIAVTLVICLLIAGAGGFLGGYYFTKENEQQAQAPSSQQPSSPSAGDKVVIQTLQNDVRSTEVYPVAQVVAQVADTVVEITTESVTNDSWLHQYVTTGAGSGVIFAENGYIVTNHHVISGASKIVVTLRSGEQYEASVVGSDEKADIAVLKIDAEGLKTAVFGESSKLVVGETAIAIGNPLGSLGGTVTTGIISALDRSITVGGQNMTLLQTNAAINPGNSGGGLFNSSGALIGIVNAKQSASGIEGLGFAIPIDVAKPVIEDLINYGYVTGRVDLGMTLLEISDMVTAMQYRVSQLGVYVYSVDSGSNAQEAGFRSGDYIQSIQGTVIGSEAEFNAVLDQYEIGDTIEITVIRSKQGKTFSLTLAEYAPSLREVA